MRSTYLAAGIAGLVGIVAACGGDDKPPIASDAAGRSNGGKNSGGKSGIDNSAGEGGDSNTTTGGRGGTQQGGKGGKGGSLSTADGGAAGAGGADAGDPENAPLVEIIAPTESLAPADGVIIDQVVHVVCSATKSSAPTADDVDPTSVRLALRDSAGKVLAEKDGTGTKNAGEYAADFVVTSVASGKVSFFCSAADRQKVKGTDTLFTYIDHGPIITVVTPKPDSANAVKGGLAVEFLVDPAPLADVDPGSEVDKVAFTLDGKPFPLEYSEGKYHTSLALDDTDTFPTIPAGAITVTATNKRAPTPATSSKSYDILVDGLGPVIAIQSPVPQAVVGGNVTLSFTVKDAGGSGVDPQSVNVTLYSGAPAQFFDVNNGWTHTGDKYTYTFDSKLVEAHAKVQTTLNVRASDMVGNPGASGQSVQIYLDNVPPQIDLDPQNVRTKSTQGCSGSFDPVGSASLNDLQGSSGNGNLNSRFGFFRAFVRERTNAEIGQSIFYFSGTVQNEVRLYVQPDPEHATTKLLVNKNPAEDSTCDDIGGIDDIQNAPQFSAMKPISATGAVGTPWNQEDANVIPLAGACTLKTDAKRPDYLCPAHTSDMWYVPFDKQLKEPHVYVVGTPNANDASCSGIDLAFLTVGQPEGWVCVAARVVDNAGNVGISPPLRVCVDAPETDFHPPCSISSVEPPSCSDGCAPPVRGGNVFVDQ